MRVVFFVAVGFLASCGAREQEGAEERRAPAASAIVAVAPPSASASAAAPIASAPAASCPSGEVWVPPTPAEGFKMGRGYRGASDPPHQVVITHGFCMDENEVSAGDYGACAESGKCDKPGQMDEWASYPRFPKHPQNLVSWVQARRYCDLEGKRLPSEAEWEWAATGPEGTRYPWGDGPDPVCGQGYADFTPLGAPKSHPGGDYGCLGGGPSDVGVNPKGDKVWPGGHIHDLGGNVWEWCEDSYAPYVVTKEPVVDPLVRQETVLHSIRGGGWNRPPRALQGAFRGTAQYHYHVPGLGFRCVRGEPFASPPPNASK